jgi:hypothetical protein
MVMGIFSENLYKEQIQKVYEKKNQVMSLKLKLIIKHSEKDNEKLVLKYKKS